MKFIRDHIMPKSRSVEELFKNLQDIGIDIEYNKGVPTGVRDSNGSFYSFKKLGITPLDFHVLNQKARFHEINNRLANLEKVRANNHHDKYLEP